VRAILLFLALSVGCATVARPALRQPAEARVVAPAATLAADVDAVAASFAARPPERRVLAAAAPDTEALAKATQNPVADLISVPLQNNFNFPVGPGDDLQWVCNIQPVWPINLNEDWNLITRTILPVIYQPSLAPGLDSEFGLGDTTFSAFLSPAKSGKLIWGAGPVILIPTSTADVLGAGQWGLGPSAVALQMSGPWVYGALVNNVWSFEGDVNSFLLQPFVNYNLPGGWYVGSAPIITANWKAPSGEEWTVPIGVQGGKITRLGKLPVNLQLGVFYNVERPAGGPDWNLRLQIQFLFPKGH